MDSLRKLFNTPIRIHLVRVGRLELPASCSQSKRATNCATPGYEVFQLWSNMGSAPVFDQFPARGKTPSALASQSFPGFWRCVARTPASRSQSRRATNCATPGYEVVGWPGRILPKQARYQLRYTRIFNLLHDSTRGKKNQAITAIKCSNIFDDFFLYLEYNTATTSKALEEFSLEKAERRH